MTTRMTTRMTWRRGGVRASERASERAMTEKTCGVYDGTVVVHVYDTLSAPKPIFSSFLEGALHVAEVARAHPNFASAHFHYALNDGENAIVEGLPNACFNFMTFDDVRAKKVWDAFGDLADAIEMGHANQIEHALACDEVATYAPSVAEPRSVLAQTCAKRKEIQAQGKEAPVFGFDESNVVMFVGVKTTSAVDVATWMNTFGIVNAEAVVGAGSFQDASLFEVVSCSKSSEREHKFTHVARVSLGPCGSDAAKVKAAEDAIRRACQSMDANVFVAPYACVYNIGKRGTPPGALPAVREINRKKKEAAAQGYVAAKN